MDYNKYETEDFVLEKSFQEWVKGRNQESIEFWENWLIANPDKEKDLLDAKELVLQLQFKGSEVSQQHIEQKIDSINNKIDSIQKPVRIKLFTPHIRNIAATVLVLLTSVICIWYYNQNSKIDSQIETIAYSDKTTNSGQKITLTLTDGTHVKLNSESKLRFPKKFTNNKREVYLEGEGFFEVAKDANRPFIIHTGNVYTKVLGTIFNIKAYPEDEEVEVALVEGRVAINTAANSGDTTIILQPSEVLNYNKQKEKIITASNVDLTKIVAWRNNQIIFEDASFEEITRKLERWYGVRFNVYNKVNDKGGFTGKFEEESLELLLEKLSHSLDFSYQINKKEVIIK